MLRFGTQFADGDRSGSSGQRLKNVELGQLDEAQAELSRVLESAPENLAAIRGLAEIYHRRGDLARALAQYRAALLLARNDPDLEETIADLSRQVEPAPPDPSGGLTLQHMQDELLKHATKGDGSHLPPPASDPESAQTRQLVGQVSPEKTPVPFSPDHEAGPPGSVANVAPPPDGTLTVGADDRATRTVAALEQWLAAIHVSREDRHS